jgi:lipoprotein-anchoring transpeptidase ErfK/SrfK
VASRRRRRPHRSAGPVAVALLGVAALVAFGGPAVAAKPPTPPHLAPPFSLVAAATGSRVAVFDHADGAAPSRVLPNPTKTGGALLFLVDRQVPGWLKVLLPIRPNGVTGWVRQSDVTLTVDPYRILVRLKAHRLTLYLLNRRILLDPVGVGRRETPTPGGRYYLTQLFHPPDPNGPYGPFAYSLSGFSNVLRTFEGGDAIIGLHGTNQPELVGHDVSHGCIRLTNDAITTLSGILPLGTPVQILDT